MRGLEAAAISPAGFARSCKANSMFDCPEATHTSPTSTSWNVMAFEAFTVSVKGPPAEDGGRYKLHLPRSSAVVLACVPRNSAATRSPDAAIPHTWMGRSRCTTMWSENRAGTVTSAAAEIAGKKKEQRRIRRENISWLRIRKEPKDAT